MLFTLPYNTDENRSLFMGKLIFKVIVMLVIMIGAANYGVYIMTGKSPFADFSWSKISINAPDVGNVLPKGKEKVYKWEKDGVIVYSSEPPPEAQNSELIEVDPNTNIVQATEVPNADTGEQSVQTPGMPDGPVYSPDQIRKIVDDAKEVRRMMDERSAEQEKALREL
jgi:hypothetical protein